MSTEIDGNMFFYAITFNHLWLKIAILRPFLDALASLDFTLVSESAVSESVHYGLSPVEKWK